MQTHQNKNNYQPYSQYQPQQQNPPDNPNNQNKPNENLHTPVMLQEMLQCLQPRLNGKYADFTYGYGGYSRAIFAISKTPLFASDRDPNAVKCAKTDPAVRIHHAKFSDLDLETQQFDGAVADLGVSSAQIDDPSRGFSFQKPGPLDMRMGLCSQSALELIKTTNSDKLEQILRLYGEEPRARSIAKAIFDARHQLSSTTDLANLVSKKTKHPTKHPATRTFQAIRIAINDELQEISILIQKAKNWLNRGAKMLITTFHSLEDRIVKLEFKTWTKTGKIMPSQEEISKNIRARSAKIRWGING